MLRKAIFILFLALSAAGVAHAGLFSDDVAHKKITELQQQVQWLGGDPENTGSTTAAIHRAWINLKSSLGAGDASIMAACETGEDTAVSAYKSVLEKALPANIRQIVAEQYEHVRASHDRVKAMRDSFDE